MLIDNIKLATVCCSLLFKANNIYKFTNNDDYYYSKSLWWTLRLGHRPGRPLWGSRSRPWIEWTLREDPSRKSLVSPQWPTSAVVKTYSLWLKLAFSQYKISITRYYPNVDFSKRNGFRLVLGQPCNKNIVDYKKWGGLMPSWEKSTKKKKNTS